MTRPWRRLGLRGRLVVALVVTSLATLAAATATVLPPLEHRIEHDRLADLRGLARTARPTLRAVPAAELRPGSPRLQEIVEDLEVRTGGRIAVLDAAGRVLATTSRAAGAPVPAGLVARAKAAERGTRDGVASLERGGQAIVATTVRAQGARLTLVLSRPLQDARAAAAVVRAALPLALVVGVAVAVALALLLSAGLLKRLGRLRADARALGDEGLGHRVAVGGTDEVAEVAGALEAVRLRLVEAEASRQAFVATASHELRTPLASLQATLELLREQVSAEDADPRAAGARVDTALRQTHRLVALATDLLDLSRLDGDVPLHLEPLELAEVAQAAGREVAERLGRDGRELALTGGPAVALADAAAVVRILRILLDNARAYGAGTVGVAVAEDGRRVRVEVSDAGPGLVPEEAERVFVRFARGSASAATPGFGLGLAIARGLARAQDGDLWAPAGGPGARFVLELPAWRDDA